MVWNAVAPWGHDLSEAMSRPVERAERDSFHPRRGRPEAAALASQLRRSELASTSFLTVVTPSMAPTQEAPSRHRRPERSDTVEHFFRFFGHDCGVASDTTSPTPARFRNSNLTGRQTGFDIASGIGARGASEHAAPHSWHRH